jgi:catechol 2,3-dioxygenase-like lactoylglutathione lyase family enzyme
VATVGAVITGAHTILYSTDAEADRAFLRDVLGFPHVDAGGGWLIFRLPPGELAVHPAESSGAVELYLVCDDVEATRADLAVAGVPFEDAVSDQGWGRLTTFSLPGGGRVGLYEARHPTAFDL